jgi:protein phosphatase
LHATTSDHSLLNELIKTGRLSEEEIANFQHKNVITRALGMADQTEVDVSAWDLEPGVVCMVTDDRIAEIIARESELQKACQTLVDEANNNGGVDNITVALVRFTA